MSEDSSQTQSSPYIPFLTDPISGESHAFFGFVLNQTRPCPPDQVAALLTKQFHLIGNLPLPDNTAIEWRYLNRTEVSAKPMLLMFCRVTRTEKLLALKSAYHAYQGIQEAFDFFLKPYYQFTALKDKVRFRALFQAVPPTHVVELTRKQEFVGETLLSRTFSVKGNHNPDWTGLLQLLERQPHPTYLAITLQPTTLYPWEKEYCLARPIPEQHRSAHGGSIAVAEQEIRTQVSDELWNPFLMKLQLVSAGPVSPFLAQVTGSTLAGYGRFEKAQPQGQHEEEIAQRSCLHLLFSTWIPNYMAEDYKRFRYLFSLRDVGELFALPINKTPASRFLPLDQPLPHDGIMIGETECHNQTVPVMIPEEDLFRHVYILGQTGTGKSTTMKQMIMDRILNGHGVGVIDPHGELIEDLLGRIPAERLDDVILFDPATTEYPIGLNLLEAQNEAQRDLLAQEFQSILLKMFGDEFFGPIAQQYNYNALLTMMENLAEPGTIIDIPVVLTNENFRKNKLKSCTNPILKHFWEHQFRWGKTDWSSDLIPYICSKYAPFTNSTIMRHILGQPKNKMNFDTILNHKKILLVNLSKGLIGELNSQLLGMIIITKVLTQALQRAKQPASQRVPFTLFIDEVQTFMVGNNRSHSSGMNQTLNTLLSEGRKYGISLVMANQFFSQLPTEIQSSIVGNAGTLIGFRLGHQDSEMLSKSLGSQLTTTDFHLQPNFHAYCRPLLQGQPHPVFSLQTTLKYLPNSHEQIAKNIRQLVRLKYGTPVAEVRTMLRNQYF